jgi:hypothetical protein
MVRTYDYPSCRTAVLLFKICFGREISAKKFRLVFVVGHVCQKKWRKIDLGNRILRPESTPEGVPDAAECVKDQNWFGYDTEEGLKLVHDFCLAGDSLNEGEYSATPHKNKNALAGFLKTWSFLPS